MNSLAFLFKGYQDLGAMWRDELEVDHVGAEFSEAFLPHLIATTSGELSTTDILRQRKVTVRGMAAMAPF